MHSNSDIKLVIFLSKVINDKLAKAKNEERRAFYGIYRLLVRSCQALMLLTRLAEVHRDYRIKVGWEQLNGMCLRVGRPKAYAGPQIVRPSWDEWVAQVAHQIKTRLLIS